MFRAYSLSVGAEDHNRNLIKKSITHVKDALWGSLIRGLSEESTKILHKTHIVQAPATQRVPSTKFQYHQYCLFLLILLFLPSPGGVRSSLAKVDKSRTDNTPFITEWESRVRLGEIGERSKSFYIYKIRFFTTYKWDRFGSAIDDEAQRLTRRFAAGWKWKIQQKLLKTLGKEILLVVSFRF